MIVVTGGAGFIGSNLVRGLNEQGHQNIVIVDDMSTATKHLNLKGCQFVDYYDKDEFLEEFPNLDDVRAVFHQGACAVTTEQDGRYMMQTNFSYSKKLLHESMRKKCPFIYASSAAVYGLGEKSFKEDQGLENPMNVYGFSKLAFDHHVRNLLPEAESQITGLRYFNVYGPRESHKGSMASVIYHMWSQYQRGERLKLFEGSENYLRDFVHVDDVVDINIHFMKTRRSGIFNGGTGKVNSFARLGEIVCSELSGSQIEKIKMPDGLKKQYQEYTCADTQLLEAAGYDAGFTKLEDGIKSYLAGLKNGAS